MAVGNPVRWGEMAMVVMGDVEGVASATAAVSQGDLETAGETVTEVMVVMVAVVEGLEGWGAACRGALAGVDEVVLEVSVAVEVVEVAEEV